MSNPKSLLGEWSQSHGHGPFQNSFRLTFDVVGEQQFRARMLQLATGLEVVGAPSVGKKNTERDACDQMYKHVVASPWPSVIPVTTHAVFDRTWDDPTTTDFKSLIGEWSQARGEGSFTVAFSLSFQQCSEQRFRAILRHKTSGHVTYGTETLGKRETMQQACDYMHRHLHTVADVRDETAVGGRTRRTYVDPKSLLGEWSQAQGLGPFASSFVMAVEQLDEQMYRATLTHPASGHSVVGEQTIGKKKSELDVCRKMYDHLTATPPAMPDRLADLQPPTGNRPIVDYKARLEEWSERRGIGSFQDNFSLTFELLGEQRYCACIICLGTDHEIRAKPSVGKRATEQDACKLMYEYVQSPGVIDDGQRQCRDAWLGDKVLSLCLGVALVALPPSELQRQMDERMHDEAIASRIRYCSGLVLAAEGRSTRQTADEVRRYVWSVFVSNGQDVGKTSHHIRALLG